MKCELQQHQAAERCRVRSERLGIQHHGPCAFECTGGPVVLPGPWHCSLSSVSEAGSR